MWVHLTWHLDGVTLGGGSIGWGDCVWGRGDLG